MGAVKDIANSLIGRETSAEKEARRQKEEQERRMKEQEEKNKQEEDYRNKLEKDQEALLKDSVDTNTQKTTVDFSKSIKLKEDEEEEEDPLSASFKSYRK